MSTKKVLVVFGVTGNQGGSVVDSMLKDPSISEQFEIRGITRDPTKPSAATLTERRITLLKADLDDKDSLRAALKDAHTVFAVTNWQEVLNKEREIQQGKNIADIAKELNIQHLIWSSLPNVTKITSGKITGVLHFDSKAIIEDHIRSLSIPSAFLHLGVFMEQLPLMLIPTSPNAKSYKLITPISTSTKIPLISVRADTGKYVKSIILNREKMLGKVVMGGVKEYTVQEAANVMVGIGGLDIVAEKCAYEEYKGMLVEFGLPEFVADDMTENMKYFEEYGFFGGGTVENDHSILSESLETLEQWVVKSPQIAAMK
ncbi:NmrA-like family protein [Cadophora sp. DSE1049]|nr:NmrA-like family protein [Cadophora sp. DSE1049]